VKMATLFPVGQLVATPGAIHAAHEAGDNLLLYICRMPLAIGVI